MNAKNTFLMIIALSAFGLGQTNAMQTTAGDKRPEFEVATVKPNHTVEVGGASINLSQRGGHLRIVNFSLRMLLGQAFNLASLSAAFDSIVGAPGWADSDRFDIEAVAEGSPTVAVKRLMLQSLLVERFKLVVHHETRERSVYALVPVKAGKPGPQIHPNNVDKPCEVVAAADGQSESALAALQSFPCGRVVGGKLKSSINPFWAGGRKVTMETIAASIGGMEMFDRPIVDQTGDRGTYDFTVQWNTQLQPLNTTPVEAPGVSLSEALRDQLGLKLVPQKGPVDVLVIDHVERPPNN